MSAHPIQIDAALQARLANQVIQFAAEIQAALEAEERRAGGKRAGVDRIAEGTGQGLGFVAGQLASFAGPAAGQAIEKAVSQGAGALLSGALGGVGATPGVARAVVEYELMDLRKFSPIVLAAVLYESNSAFCLQAPGNAQRSGSQLARYIQSQITSHPKYQPFLATCQALFDSLTQQQLQRLPQIAPVANAYLYHHPRYDPAHALDVSDTNVVGGIETGRTRLGRSGGLISEPPMTQGNLSRRGRQGETPRARQLRVISTFLLILKGHIDRQAATAPHGDRGKWQLFKTRLDDTLTMLQEFPGPLLAYALHGDRSETGMLIAARDPKRTMMSTEESRVLNEFDAVMHRMPFYGEYAETLNEFRSSFSQADMRAIKVNPRPTGLFDRLIDSVSYRNVGNRTLDSDLGDLMAYLWQRDLAHERRMGLSLETLARAVVSRQIHE